MLNLPSTWKEEKELTDSAMHYISLLSLEDSVRATVKSLPFGKQRAVELARALAGEPELLLLDEPASGLNTRETAEALSITEETVKVRLHRARAFVRNQLKGYYEGKA